MFEDSGTETWQADLQHLVQLDLCQPHKGLDLSGTAVEIVDAEGEHADAFNAHLYAPLQGLQ